jgi:hydrogenase maturation protease
MPILIIGIGSPFGEDQIGWLIAKKLQLAARLSKLIQTGAVIITQVDRPGLNLLKYLQGNYQMIILIDLVKTKYNPPGTIYRLNAAKIISSDPLLSSHNFGVASSLALAQALRISLKPIKFWGIEGGFAHQRLITLTPKLIAAINLICTQIIKIITLKLAKQDELFRK